MSDFFAFRLQDWQLFLLILVRISVLMAFIPVLGDRMVPGPLKILFSLVFSYLLAPRLIPKSVAFSEKQLWGFLAGEVVFALMLSFSARMFFEMFHMGASLIAQFMGFASASQMDPHQESQTELLAQFQQAFMMLLFVSMDGHALLVRIMMQTYDWMPIGAFLPGAHMSSSWIEVFGGLFRFGFCWAAPVCIVMLMIQVAFGVLSKAVPQLNILSISMGVSVTFGFWTMYLSADTYFDQMIGEFAHLESWLKVLMKDAV